MSLTVTPEALKEISRIMTEQGLNTNDTVLRFGVQGGGCSGFSYSMKFDNKEAVDPLLDTVYNFDELTAVVEQKSNQYLDGTVINFYQGIDRRGFTFENPNAKRGCGCGQSFSV
jgi:iron-sulfur cluster assembly protein